MAPRSLSFRLVLGASFAVIAALLVAGFVLNALVRDHVERSFDAQLSIQLDSLVTVTVADSGGLPIPQRVLGDPRFQQPLSGLYWQITPIGRGEPVLSRSLWTYELETPDDLPRGEKVFHDFALSTGERLRAVSQSIAILDSDIDAVFTVAADRAAIADSLRPFAVILALALVALATILIVSVVLLIRFGLQPLRRIPRALAAIRSGRAERLTGDFPSEVEPLVVEINALIDHNENVVDRARTHVGNLAHALKTPLTVLGNEANRHDGTLAELVARQAGVMARYVDHYLTRARTAARGRVLGARTDVAPVVQELTRLLGRIHAEAGVEIAFDGGEVAFRGEREDLEEMLGNLMENACKWARRRVRVSARRAADRVILSVEDDGPGLKPEERARALARGQKLDETKPGTGLGLAIVADIAEQYDGRVALEDSDLGGLAARLDLPAAPEG